MIIKILGVGCSDCEKLEANSKIAIEELGLEASIEKEGDFVEMVRYGVMQAPALLVNDVIKTVGKSASVKQIKKYIQEEM